jgi:hypothetical protein
VAVISAETPGGLDLIADIKGGATAQRVPVILVSERWTKKEFFW